MNNAIEINGITIEAKFAKGLVSLTFTKDSKVVKVCDSSEAARFVRPENLSKVTAIINAAKDSIEASEYWTAKKVERDAYEAEYQARTGNYEARNREIQTAMAI